MEKPSDKSEYTKPSFWANQKQILFLPYAKNIAIQKVNDEPNNNEGNQGQKSQKIKLVPIQFPKKNSTDIVVWVDPNIIQNARAYKHVINLHPNELKGFNLVQLVSNQHFKLWISEYEYLFKQQKYRIHFMSNMNRQPKFEQEGIQTLQIARKLSPKAHFVYYIGNVEKTRLTLQQRGKQNDQNVEVIKSLKDLERVFTENFVSK